nr:hypothetical protein CKG001_30590 [Bdellovibrio sp. CKG001]
MKSTGMKILFSALVLTLAACSGGGGGGGGGSNSGDVANPTPTITNPPTKASGTASELGTILGTVDEAATQVAVQNMVDDFELPTTGMSPALKVLSSVRAGESCITANEGWDIDADHDRFLDDASVKATNCEVTKSEEGVGTSYMTASLQSKDTDTTTFWADASIAYSSNMITKNASGATDGQYYFSFKSTLDMAKGTLMINSKEGGYDKSKEEAHEYSAFWLTFASDEVGVISLSGYVQYYSEGKGLVTLQVIGTDGSVNESTECIEGINVSLKYASGDTAGSVSGKTLCLAGTVETVTKAGLK